MAALVDTNVLLRLVQPNHPHTAIAERALNLLYSQGETFYVASQNLVEFWVVATRPLTQNGLGLSPDKALIEMRQIKNIFRLLPEVPIHNVWEQIVKQYQVSGKSAHDARLVAVMQAHSVGRIVTFNAEDFKKYTSLEVVDPLTLS
jgi:predicted nucleic acid-binding protein